MHSAELVFALALAAGVVCQLLAHHTRVPSIAVLFAAGLALGPDGLDWLRPSALGHGLEVVVALGVAVILFEGGLSLEAARLRRQSRPIRNLVTLGLLVTAVGASLAARIGLDWPWRQSVLFGSLVVVTGPTVIRPLLEHVRPRPRLGTILEAEGVLNDPIGAIYAAVVLQLVASAPATALLPALADFAARIAFGALAGAGFGYALGRILGVRGLLPGALENISVLGIVLVFFSLCEAVLTESGLLAVTVAGVVTANLEHRVSEGLREFKEQLTLALIGLLFVLLAADMRVAEVTALGWAGLGTVVALAFVVRPLCVLASTVGSGLSWREQAFLAWVGPRGIVAAAVASLAALYMERSGMSGGSELRALVFLTIAFTVVVQGGLAPLVVRILGVRAPGRDTVLILGAGEIGRLLASLLRSTGRRSLLVDYDPQRVRLAEEGGLDVLYGNGLEERTLERAKPGRALAALALTANDEVNVLFAQRARDRGIENVFVAINPREAGATPDLVRRDEGRVLFDRPTDVHQWNKWLRRGDVELAYFEHTGEESGAPPESRANLPYLVIATRGDEGWQPMFERFAPAKGSGAAVLLRKQDEESARRELAARGWRAGVA